EYGSCGHAPVLCREDRGPRYEKPTPGGSRRWVLGISETKLRAGRPLLQGWRHQPQRPRPECCDAFITRRSIPKRCDECQNRASRDRGGRRLVPPAEATRKCLHVQGVHVGPQGMLIRNATVFDGSGTPPRIEDVLVRDRRIAARGTGL